MQNLKIILVFQQCWTALYSNLLRVIIECYLNGYIFSLCRTWLSALPSPYCPLRPPTLPNYPIFLICSTVLLFLWRSISTVGRGRLQAVARTGLPCFICDMGAGDHQLMVVWPLAKGNDFGGVFQWRWRIFNGWKSRWRLWGWRVAGKLRCNLTTKGWSLWSSCDWKTRKILRCVSKA